MVLAEEADMSRLTFIGWLKLELIRMSGCRTVSIHKLAILAQEDNSRLAEPLLLYAREIMAVRRLLSYIFEEQLLEEYRLVVKICGWKHILELSDEEAEQLPWSYRKLLFNWRAVDSKKANLEKSKQMRLERSTQLKNEKGISNSQIYHTLGLNPGNTNAYFKNQDISKLSLKNATKIMKYLYEQ